MNGALSAGTNGPLYIILDFVSKQTRDSADTAGCAFLSERPLIPPQVSIMYCLQRVGIGLPFNLEIHLHIQFNYIIAIAAH